MMSTATWALAFISRMVFFSVSAERLSRSSSVSRWKAWRVVVMSVPLPDRCPSSARLSHTPCRPCRDWL